MWGGGWGMAGWLTGRTAMCRLGLGDWASARSQPTTADRLEVGHCQVTACHYLQPGGLLESRRSGFVRPLDRRARIPLERATMPQERRTTQPACKPLASAWRRSYNPPGALPKVEPSPLTFSARSGICRELMAYKKCSPAANPSQRWT